MKTRIAKRVGRIISGSVHALMDAIEGTTPEIVMEQTIREVDGAIDEVREELGRAIASKHLASQRLAQKSTEHEELTEKARTAIDEKRDDLAEAAIARQLDIEAQIPVLEETIRDAGEKEKELESYVAALQAKKREMEEEAAAFRSSKSRLSPDGAASTEVGASRGSSVEKKVADAASSFNRVLARHTNQKLSTLDSAECSAPLAELEHLARQNRVQERLALLKS